MTSEERAELLRLAGRIHTEQNPEIFGKLLAELNELLVRTESEHLAGAPGCKSS